MTSLSFPDVNVWLALAASEHVHHKLAIRWWKQETRRVGFSRFTQLGFLRLMTTVAAMDGKPLVMSEAWRVHDRFYDDSRVIFIPEPAGIDEHFREYTSGGTASPKVWADAWLRAFGRATEATLVTFDRALAKSCADCLLIEGRESA